MICSPFQPRCEEGKGKKKGKLKLRGASALLTKCVFDRFRIMISRAILRAPEAKGARRRARSRMALRRTSATAATREGSVQLHCLEQRAEVGLKGVVARHRTWRSVRGRRPFRKAFATEELGAMACGAHL